MESFVCTGPKSCAVRIRTKGNVIKHIVKAKGFTINKETIKDVINFEKLLKLVVEKCSENNESLYEDIKFNDAIRFWPWPEYIPMMMNTLMSYHIKWQLE